MTTVLPLGRMASSFPSDRIRYVDELVLDPESFGHELAQSSDSQRFRRIVAGGEEMDPGLAGVGHHVVPRLARAERIEPPGDRLLQAVSSRARAARDYAAHSFGARHLEAVRAVVLEACDVEETVEERDDLAGLDAVRWGRSRTARQVPNKRYSSASSR